MRENGAVSFESLQHQLSVSLHSNLFIMKYSSIEAIRYFRCLSRWSEKQNRFVLRNAFISWPIRSFPSHLKQYTYLGDSLCKSREIQDKINLNVRLDFSCDQRPALHTHSPKQNKKITFFFVRSLFNITNTEKKIVNIKWREKNNRNAKYIRRVTKREKNRRSLRRKA